MKENTASEISVSCYSITRTLAEPNISVESEDRLSIQIGPALHLFIRTDDWFDLIDAVAAEISRHYYNNRGKTK